MTLTPQLGLLVVLVGGLAAVARLLTSRAIAPTDGAAFPRAVLLVNALASALAGCVGGAAASGRVGEGAALVLLTGLAGGLSTFSTFAVDTVELVRRGRLRLAVANVAANIGACTLLCAGCFVLCR